MCEIFGYVRVSSKDQNEDRQLIAMDEQNVPRKNVYVDKQSGKDFARPMYRKLVRRLKENDLVYIKSIDRLGRNYEEIQEQWRFITKDKKADIVVIDMPLLDTRRGKDLIGTFLSDIVLQVLSFVAENERENIRQRQAEGIQAARARGVVFGRPRLREPADFDAICRDWREKKITPDEAARLAGMSRSAFYVHLKNHENEHCSEKPESSTLQDTQDQKNTYECYHIFP